jgi:meso-butanediol dehydrogenase/(S,S)-butanediol dehydrogenase/diacetyl reductase
VTRLVADTAREAGRVDVLVSNAFATAFGSLESLGLAEWTRTLDVTLTPVFTALRAVIPVMRAQGGGAVVNVASISGLAGDRGLGAYNAAKAAVVNLTRTAALELARARIRVNAVCPGSSRRRPWRGRSAGSPSARRPCARPSRSAASAIPEVARAILFLASDGASYVTGTTLVVDGGLSAGTGIPDLVPGTSR